MIGCALDRGFAMRGRLTRTALVVALGIAGIAAAAPAAAQPTDPAVAASTPGVQEISTGRQFALGARPSTTSAAQAELQVRITARLLDNGRIEFALQQRQADGDWGERLLPVRRFFPPDAEVGAWLSSSPLTLSAEAVLTPDPATDVQIRIVARQHSSGRTEFALQQRQASGDWGERLLPARRFFPTQAEVGEWLVSASVTLTVTPPATGFTALAAGHRHLCGLRADGLVECWGLNYAGEAEPPNTRFTAISSGDKYSCGLRTDGAIRCWGSNRFGQLNAPSGQFGAISAGMQHACGLRTDGTIRCWGRNISGQTDAPDG